MARLNFGKEYCNALVDTFLISLFTVLPTVVCIFISIFDKNQTSTWLNLYKAGEFFLYSVSFLGTSYIVLNQFSIKNRNLNNCSKISLALILLASIAYGALKFINNVDSNCVFIFSAIFFIVAIILLYYSQVILYRNSPDISETRAVEIDAIKERLN